MRYQRYFIGMVTDARFLTIDVFQHWKTLATQEKIEVEYRESLYPPAWRGVSLFLSARKRVKLEAFGVPDGYPARRQTSQSAYRSFPFNVFVGNSASKRKNLAGEILLQVLQEERCLLWEVPERMILLTDQYYKFSPHPLVPRHFARLLYRMARQVSGDPGTCR